MIEADRAAERADISRDAAPDTSPDGGAGWRVPAAWLATAVLLFMVTKGPVFWIRLESASMRGDFIDDVWVQSAFVAAGAIVAALAWPAARTLARDRVAIVAFGALLGLVALSGAWSVVPSRTLEQAAMMATGTVAALLAGAYLTRTGALLAIVVATHAGVLASVWADVRDWMRSLDHNGDLAGIYFNRNSLGPVALLAAVSAAVAAVVLYRRAEPRPRLASGVLTVAVFVDLEVLRRSGSLTPLFGFGVAVIGVGLLALCLPGPRAQTRRTIAAVLGAVVAVGAVVMIAARGVVTDALGRTPTFTGRTEIWDVVLDFVGDRPLHGWGFMAVWRKPAIIEALDTRYDREVYEAHSGYMEVLLGVGVVGLIALVVVVVIAGHRTATVALGRPTILTLWSFGLVVYAVAVNAGETYVGANLLPWLLLALATGQAIGARREPR